MSGKALPALFRRLSEDEDQEAKARSEALQRSTLVPDNTEHVEQLRTPHEDKKQEKKEPLKNLKKMYLEEDEENKLIPPTKVIGGY